MTRLQIPNLFLKKRPLSPTHPLQSLPPPLLFTLFWTVVVPDGTGFVADIQKYLLEGTGYDLQVPEYISNVTSFRAEALGLRRKVLRSR